MGKRSFLLIGAALLAVGAIAGRPGQGSRWDPVHLRVGRGRFARALQLAELGTVTSNGETGTITCNGPVNGKQPTGPGRSGWTPATAPRGAPRASRAAPVTGSSRSPSRPPAGAEHVTSHFTYTSAGCRTACSSRSNDGDRMSGTTEVTPRTATAPRGR